MSKKQLQLAVLALLSAVLCGIAWAVDHAFATSMFAYLTCGIVLVFLAVRKLGAYGADTPYDSC